ncbi:hypothetical protein JOQ06_012120, partial [Pogonophryne albipinna]
MSQPAQNNPYGLSPVPLLCSSASYSPPPCFPSSVWIYPSHATPPCLRIGARIMGRSSRRNPEQENERRFSDDVGKESMGHSQYQECKSIGRKLQNLEE